MSSGSCLCGKVSFSIVEEIPGITLDHCPRCRKSTGSAFSAEIVIPVEKLTISGENYLKVFELPVENKPPGYKRTFCENCGCLMPSRHGDVYIVPAGSLDIDPQISIKEHIFVESKASWFEINDDNPQYAKKP